MKNILCSKYKIRTRCFLISLSLAIASSNHLAASGIECTEGDTVSINDGPYIYFDYDILKVRWIENNNLVEEDLTASGFEDIKEKFNLLYNFHDLQNTFLISPAFRQNYRNIDSIALISDVHGQYDIYINLLKKNGIIGEDLCWKFGKGHLVVLGDVFDRGDKVTEIFWHLFGLEKQALKSGGRVHFLLGNHEAMILGCATSYIHDKYKKVEKITGKYYCDLYSGNSVLGRWLRSKPVIASINDIVFVHAGLSADIIKQKLKIAKINRLFCEKIIAKDYSLIEKNQDLLLLSDENGPLWYRGYFFDRSFNENRIDSVLDFYEKKHVVVGHTVTKEIVSVFNKKIIGCDAGIMYRNPGEMLIVKKGVFHRGLSNGERIKL
ncbi:MAG TPA: metallophosphoesterase [Bacteroidales bacterium]|nr:metallophosphoesterase [Bacteroidales bacterium]HQH25447.1 metallophosphoesterase [Bacteroidales bacterium]HQJ83138.1 metallophosphoesterase [Bacteroidales bacterium]